MSADAFRRRVLGFVRACSAGVPGAYRGCANGEVTLYGSCFAAMTLHYLGALETLPAAARTDWAAWIGQWQDPKSGSFAGPELRDGALESPLHDREHLELHQTAHALPALELLGARPPHPLRAARRFLDPAELGAWLAARDWRYAWREGNDLLFVGQLLLHHAAEGEPAAAGALARWFDWLDAQQDPATGLWGTNAGADARAALFGGYHPLLVYHSCRRPVAHAERAIDLTLSLQHPDGGFAARRGGGACEDVDAVDVLVNLHRRTGHRPRAVRRALRRALASVLRRQLPDGGFVYRRGEPFVHMGMSHTAVPADTSQLFATWFAVHTVALACQLLPEHPLAAFDWRFNRSCSMGWHDPTPRAPARSDPLRDRLPDAWQVAGAHARHAVARALGAARRRAGALRRRLARGDRA